MLPLPFLFNSSSNFISFTRKWLLVACNLVYSRAVIADHDLELNYIQTLKQPIWSVYDANSNVCQPLCTILAISFFFLCKTFAIRHCCSQRPMQMVAENNYSNRPHSITCSFDWGERELGTFQIQGNPFLRIQSHSQRDWTRLPHNHWTIPRWRPAYYAEHTIISISMKPKPKTVSASNFRFECI